MIHFQDEGAYQITVFEGAYKIGSILSFEGKIWWFKPLNGMPWEHSESLDVVKSEIKKVYHE